MKSQDFGALKPRPIPAGTKPMFVITLRKDRARPWFREEFFFLEREPAVEAAQFLQKKYPEARVNLNGGAYVSIEGRIFQIRQQQLNGSFSTFEKGRIEPTLHPSDTA